MLLFVVFYSNLLDQKTFVITAEGNGHPKFILNCCYRKNGKLIIWI